MINREIRLKHTLKPICFDLLVQLKIIIYQAIIIIEEVLVLIALYLVPIYYLLQ